MLVIIGLLLGGILKGQEMITQAKIKNVIADFSGVSAAYYGYQDRYRAIPGDDTTRRRAGRPRLRGGRSGDGNGVVAGNYNDAHGRPRVAASSGTTCGAPASSRAPATDQPFNAVAGMHRRADRRRRRRRAGAWRRRRPALTSA